MKRTIEDTMSKRFKWADSPPAPVTAGNRRLSVYDVIVQRLKKRPGRWARVREGMRESAAYAAKSAAKKRYPNVKWTNVRNEDGSFDLWASYPNQEEQ